MPIQDYRAQTTAPGLAQGREFSLERAGETSGFQRLGGAVQELSSTLENARQTTELNDARVRLTEGLGAINADLTQDTDFATMRDRYGKSLKELGSKVMDGVSTPRLKQAMGLEYTRAKVAAEANVFAREQNLMGNHARATVKRLVRGASSTIPTAGSPQEAAGLYDSARNAIDGLVKDGFIDADQAENWHSDLDGNVSTALALDAINRDPSAAAAALAEPGAYGLEEIPRQKYLAAATREAEANTTQGKAKLEREVDTARRILVTGGTVAKEDLDGLQERAAGTEYEVPLAAAVQASSQLGNFAAATPEARRGFIKAHTEKGIELDDASIGSAFLSSLEQIDKALTASEAEGERAIGATVREAVVALGDGRKVADLDAVVASAKGSAFEGELDLAMKRAEFVEEYRKSSGDDRAALLADARSSGVFTKNRTADEAFLSSLEEIDKAARVAVKKDPVQYALDNQMRGAAPLDLGDQDSVNARMALVGYMVESYGAKPQIFTDEERAQFKTAVNDGSPEDQLAFVVSVVDGFGPGANAVFREVDGIDPVVKRAGYLVLETGSVETAGLILKGRKAMKAGNELSIASQDAVATFEAGLDVAFRADPQQRSEIIETVKAYYAAEAPGRVTLANIDGQEKLLNEGLQRVLGGELVRGEQRGGIQKVNGWSTRLVPGATNKDVERVLSAATAEQWRAASLSGGDPHEGDDVVLPGNAVLQWVDGSIYRVGVASNRGAVEFYQDPGVDNGYFYVDLSRLMAEVPDE